MAIEHITTLPNCISPEERKIISASTPASFADIPPVLYHKEENVSVALDPPLQGFSAEDGASGSLYVVESALVFLSSTGRGFQIDYPSITLHAISRTEEGPSIYCQLEEPSENDAPVADEETSNMRELVIYPKDASSLEPIFDNLSLCASLHPDPNDADEMDDEDEDTFVDPGEFESFDGDASQEFSEVGKAALAHLESIIYDPFAQPEDPEQFEDAPEEANGHASAAAERDPPKESDST